MSMGAETIEAFGDLLRRHRLEALAECAGLSARNIQNLERSANRPVRDTARRLADALDLAAEDRALPGCLHADPASPYRIGIGG